MLITRTSLLSGREYTMDLDVTEDELERVRGGELIQNVLWRLSADEREFLLTGAGPGEWDEFMSDDEDDLYEGGGPNA